MSSDPSVVTMTTPQGFLAEVDARTGRFRRVRLGMCERPGEAAVFFGIDAPSEVLQAALQANDLFLVAACQPPLMGLSTVACFADWCFPLDLGAQSSAGDYRTILILKAGRGAVADLVRDPGLWTEGVTFAAGADGIGDPRDLSNWLAAFMELAVVRAETDSLFRPFAQRVTNSAWAGMLVLDLPLDPAIAFPTELRQLAPGVAPGGLRAHHIGFDLTAVQSAPAQPVPLSPWFGLIDFRDDDDHRQGLALNYQAGHFTDSRGKRPGPATLLSLRAAFENALLIDFAAQVAVPPAQSPPVAPPRARGYGKVMASQPNPPEIAYVTSRRVACDGLAADPALGHPRVFLQVDDSGFVECGYCDKRFILEGGPADAR